MRTIRVSLAFVAVVFLIIGCANKMQTAEPMDSDLISAPSDWLADTDKRIEKVRMAPFTVEVQDANGDPIGGADVRVKMVRHSFLFGSAVKTRLINDPEAQGYRDKILELFTSVTFENALKAKGWTGENGDVLGRESTLKALEWVVEQDLDFRGHALVWPNWNTTPSFYKETHEAGGNEALMALYPKHIDDITTATKGMVSEWDVLNEPTRLAAILDTLGIEVTDDWFKQARKNLPDARLFLNVTNIVPAASFDQPNVLKFFDIVAYLKENAPIDGLGLQSHFGGQRPIPSNEEIVRRLNILAAYDLPLRVTEFTVRGADDARQAEFTRDYMTIIFSHPSFTGFTFWGFWEDEVHRPENALFKTDWSAKTNGQVYMDLVFDAWWTDESGATDEAGAFSGRGFLGRYEVTATHGGKTESVSILLNKDSEPIVIQIGK